MADVVITGLEELAKKLQGLAKAMNKKVSGRATASAAQIVKKQAQANAPTGHEERGAFFFKGEHKGVVVPGNLKKSIILKRVRLNKNLTSEHIVTVRTKPSAKGPGAFYGKFVEFGTVKMNAQPFLRPAYLSEKGRATDAMVDTLRKSIQKLEGADGSVG